MITAGVLFLSLCMAVIALALGIVVRVIARSVREVLRETRRVAAEVRQFVGSINGKNKGKLAVRVNDVKYAKSTMPKPTDARITIGIENTNPRESSRGDKGKKTKRVWSPSLSLVKVKNLEFRK